MFPRQQLPKDGWIAGELETVGCGVTLNTFLPLSGLSFSSSNKGLALGCSLQLSRSVVRLWALWHLGHLLAHLFLPGGGGGGQRGMGLFLFFPFKPTRGFRSVAILPAQGRSQA